jgi:hypothetical protein
VGDDVITLVMGISMLTLLLPHMALIALRVRTRLSMENTPAVCRFGVADRTLRPITSSESLVT